MIDLKTDYLGFELSSPLVASSSPLCEDLDNLRRMEDAGAAAVALHSLFEEQITLEMMTSALLKYRIEHLSAVRAELLE